MARPLKPLVKSGGYYPSRKWTPLVYAGGRTTMADVGGGEPIDPLNTFSGAIASFKCSEARPLVDLTVGIEPVQSGSGDPSPSNIRPISGWSGANVTRTGKNLLPALMHGITSSADGTQYPHTGSHYITPNGIVAIKPSQTYYLSYVAPSGYDISVLSLIEYGRDGAFLRSISQSSHAFTVSADAYFLSFNLWIDPAFQGNISVLGNLYPQLELGSTASSYEPYSGDTYSITFPSEAGTVYGGTLDVTTGKLTVDKANIASYSGETLPGKWISDRDVYAAGTNPTTGAQVVYELATPIEYTLSPTEVTTLLGTNNVWADTGDVTAQAYATAL